MLRLNPTVNLLQSCKVSDAFNLEDSWTMPYVLHMHRCEVRHLLIVHQLHNYCQVLYSGCRTLIGRKLPLRLQQGKVLTGWLPQWHLHSAPR